MRTNTKTPTEIDRAVARRVREVRCARGFTMQTMALRLGISSQQYHKYETGANRISAGVLWRMAHMLAVQIQELFPESPALACSASATEKPIAGLSKLDKETRKALYALVNTIAGKRKD